jgi:hypothetical protein
VERAGFIGMRDTALVTAGCLVAGVLTPGVPIVGVPLCAISLAWLAYRYRVAHAVGLAVLTSVVAGAVNGWPAMLMVAPALLAAGPFAASAVGRRSPWTVVAVVSGATYGGALLMIEADALARGTSLVGMMREASSQAADLTRSLLSTSGSANAQAMREQVEAIRIVVFQTWPSFYLLLATMVGMLTVIGVIWVARRSGHEVNELPALERFDLSWHIVWPVAVGFAALAVSRYSNAPAGIAATIGANVMLLARWALFVQGVAVFAGMYRKAGIGRIGRGVGYAALSFAETITPVGWPLGLVSVTGLVDLWANLRKLPRRTEELPVASPQGPDGTQ